jgi:hypothetical protein
MSLAMTVSVMAKAVVDQTLPAQALQALSITVGVQGWCRTVLGKLLKIAEKYVHSDPSEPSGLL